MARYKLTQAAMIGDVRYEPGTEVEYDGIPGTHMEPLDEAAKKAVADRDKDKPAPDAGMRAYPAEQVTPGVPHPPGTPRRDEEKKEEPGTPPGGVPRRG